MVKVVRAWHFLKGTRRLGYDDGRLVLVGETLSFTGPGDPQCCERGMHGSPMVLDALQYAPGPVLCRVELSGKMDIQNDKISAEHRKVLVMVDATDALDSFARRCALDVAHLWPTPDIVREYLETGDRSIEGDARRALSDFSRKSNYKSWSVEQHAWTTAWDLTWGSATDAARCVANGTVWSLTLAGTVPGCDTATLKKVHRDEYSKRLDEMCLKLVGE